ncbi:MAG: thiol protease/hemagglutinin PrtT [Saprospiraceae bacterium]|nr:thiol protease/hemagglutinin PrtT [Candidatus Vicinibacter affinis]
MKKVLCLLILMNSIHLNGFSATVNLDVAKQVALFFANHISAVRIEKVELAHKAESTNHVPVFFIFNLNANDGYIIISAEDVATPVMGYSLKGRFTSIDMPINLQKWLTEYKEQIFYIRDNNLQAPPKIKQLWQDYYQGIFSVKDQISSVLPLMNTIWNQRPYYNDLCPGGSVTGCGATAMTQIMKYWNYPKQGTGFHSYNHPSYGTLSVNFGNATYDWSKMPNDVRGYNFDVANLMYHCGVAQNMDYSPQTSSSGLYTIDEAFKTYFGYKQSTQVYNRQNYGTAEWVNLLKNELDNSRPLLYRGAGTGGGHFFDIDGYDNNNFFHINWGWGGAYDGYFTIDALNPGGVGTGGGTGGYNSGHYAILGIQPEQTSTGSFDLSLYSAMEVNPTSLGSNQAFKVSVKIANLGMSAFSGDFCAAVFTNEGVFVEFVQILNNQNLQNGFYNTYEFNSAGMTLIPGKHTIGLYYRNPDKEWTLINQSTYNNPISLTVASNANVIAMYSKMNFSSNPIVQDQAFTVTADIANYGATDFKGWLSADIFDKEGKWVETIAEIENTVIKAGFFNSGFQFSNDGLSLDPGSYYIALFNSTNYTDWYILSNTLYDNPVLINVVSPGITADKYEDNNSRETAYNLPYTFNGSQAHINTIGSNFHNRTEYDFYKVILPAGSEYKIETKIGDRFSSLDGKDYSADILISYDLGNGYSEAYDYSIPNNIILKNGGEALFYIAPYSAGETGTYILDLKITKTQPSASKDFINENLLNCSPNPANNLLYLETTATLTGASDVKIFNTTGQLIKAINKISIGTQKMPIDVSSLQNGLYYLKIQNQLMESNSIKINILH